MIKECPKGINKSSPKSIRNDTCGGDLYCRSCGVEFESPQQPKKQTNFERITASAEVLAAELANGFCPACAYKDDRIKCESAQTYNDCVKTQAKQIVKVLTKWIESGNI